METELRKRRDRITAGVSKERRAQLLNQRRLESDFMNSPVAVLPTLIRNRDVELLEQILDELTFLDEELVQTLGLSTLSIKAYADESDEKMKRVLFKLINRLRLWHSSWLNEAMHLLPANSDMLKEIVIYIESHDVKNIAKLEGAVVQKLITAAEQCKMEDLPLMVAIVGGFQASLTNLHKKQFTPALVRALTTNNLQALIMTMELLNDIQANSPGAIPLLVQQKSGLLKVASGKDYQSSSTAFELISNLLSKEDEVLLRFLNEPEFEGVLKKHLTHTFAMRRRTAYWAYSNLAAADAGIPLALKLLPTLVSNYLIEQNLHEKVQILFGLVNLVYLASHEELRTIMAHSGAVQTVLECLDMDLPDLTVKFTEAMILASQKSKLWLICLKRAMIEEKLNVLTNSPNEEISHRCDKLLDLLMSPDNEDY